MNKRLDKLRRLMSRDGIEALWVRQRENLRYLSGFTGDSGQLIITGEKQLLLTDGRFTEQAAREAAGYEIIDLGNSPWEKLRDVLLAAGVKKLHFEAEHLTFSMYEDFVSRARDWSPTVKLMPSKGLVEKLRMVKEKEEIEFLRKAIKLGDAGFNHILQYIRPGVTERDISTELEYFLARMGSEKPSFDTIIAGGPRSALPHGVASDRKLQPGDVIVVDFGAVYNGYHSDLTRTVALAPVNRFWHNLHKIVLEAQKRGIETVEPGKKASEVDAAARKYIASAGYGEYFSHGLGHGIGLAVHEGPVVSSRNHEKLIPGMVFTIEPGIYIPGQGGVRIEDVVLVQEEGVCLLTGAFKEFIEL